MDVVKIYHDPRGHTLTVWFDDPEKEHASEETGDEVVLIKDMDGRVIGFELLNGEPSTSGPIKVELAEA